MVIHQIIRAIEYCPHCSTDKGPQRMKLIGDKTIGSKYSLFYSCEKCGHYYESYVKGPYRLDEIPK